MTHAEYCKKWRKDNPEYAQEQLAAKRKKYAEDSEHRAYTLRYNVLRRYKITPEQFEAHLAAQGGHCALCPAVAGKHRLHQDHDPACCKTKFKCGKCNRGILCSECNVSLGYLERFYSDCWEILPTEDTWTYRALQYITKFRLRRPQHD